MTRIYNSLICFVTLMILIACGSNEMSEKEYAAEDYLQHKHRYELMDLNVHSVELSFYKKDSDGNDIYAVEYVVSGDNYYNERVHNRKKCLLKEISKNSFVEYYDVDFEKSLFLFDEKCHKK